MKFLVWVFKSFGFKAGVTYCWDAFWLKVRRKLGISPPPIKYEGLSFDDLEDMREIVNGTDKRTLH